MLKIAFVCHGNICRSPMAEFVFKNMVKNMNLEKDFFICSFATSDEEIFCGIGNKIHKGTIEIFNKYSIPYDKEKRATQLTKKDYDRFDLFIGMDLANIRNMKRIFSQDSQSKIKPLLSFAGIEREVMDPWYTGNFEKTYEDICLGCKGLLSKLGEIK